MKTLLSFTSIHMVPITEGYPAFTGASDWKCARAALNTTRQFLHCKQL